MLEHEGNRAVRSGEWEFVATHTERRQLCSGVNDCAKSINLFKEHPHKVRDLQELYDACVKRCGVEPWPRK